MYKYNIYLGYQREIGGFPLLGTIEYGYQLNKGDVIIVANEIFEAIGKVANKVSKDSLRFNQQYRIASIHHTIDFKSQIPDIYLVTEREYTDRYSEIVGVTAEIQNLLKESNLHDDSIQEILKSLSDISNADTKNNAESYYRRVMNTLNNANDDSNTFLVIKEAINNLIKILW